jgi:FHA domain
MFMQRTASLWIGCGVLAAPIIFSGSALVFDVGHIVGSFQSTSNFTRHLIANGYHAAPALMICLALLMVVPLIALMSPVVFEMRRPADATRCFKTGSADIGIPAITGGELNRPSHAFLEVVGAADTRFAILRDMLRIGREDDNDIRIPSNAVHRYHAAIHREHQDGWRITDLSGTGGNGIRVNGKRCAEAHLSDGDVIELGPGRLRFRAGLI